MSAKHTAGPWNYRKSISGYSIGPDDEAIAYTLGNNTPKGMERERSGENMANVMLIAQAPALLAIARAAYEYAPNEIEALKIRRVLMALQS